MGEKKHVQKHFKGNTAQFSLVVWGLLSIYDLYVSSLSGSVFQYDSFILPCHRLVAVHFNSHCGSG